MSQPLVLSLFPGQWSGPTPAVTSNVGGRGKRDKNIRTYAPGAVTSSDGGASKRMWRYKIEDALKLQGLPDDFFKFSPFTAEGKRHAIANGVPLPMGRAIAKAVRRAMYPETTEASA